MICLLHVAPIVSKNVTMADLGCQGELLNGVSHKGLIILTAVESMPKEPRLIACVWTVISYLFDTNKFAQGPILILRPTYHKNSVEYCRRTGTKIQYLYAI